jgi:hypothetical protein
MMEIKIGNKTFQTYPRKDNSIDLYVDCDMKQFAIHFKNEQEIYQLTDFLNLTVEEAPIQ